VLVVRVRHIHDALRVRVALDVLHDLLGRFETLIVDGDPLIVGSVHIGRFDPFGGQSFLIELLVLVAVPIIFEVGESIEAEEVFVVEERVESLNEAFDVGIGLFEILELSVDPISHFGHEEFIIFKQLADIDFPGRFFDAGVEQ
jgi:hypothetical protein